MLVNLKEILKTADNRKVAVGAFNTPNYECVLAVMDAAEKLGVPVILSHAELHEPVAPLSEIGPVMMAAARAASVPVCVHLDHCEHFDYMCKALDLGFTGVMYDGSLLPYEENLENTKKAVEIAGYGPEVVEAKFGGMLNAFKYGAPPHGGAAFGFDRIVMMLEHEDFIREVIAFPFNQQAQDLLMHAPSPVTEKQLREVHIKLR